MKHFAKICLGLTLGLGVAGISYTATSDTALVSFVISAINELAITESSVSLTINTAAAGSQPTSATNTASYKISTNCTANAKKITAKIDTAMPSGLTLKLNCTAPSGATNAGTITMSTSDANVVTGIDAVAYPGTNNMTFTLDATVSAGIVSGSKTLTLTLTDS